MATIYTDPFMYLTIHKRLAAQPSVEWANTYAFAWETGSPAGDARYTKMVDIANAFFRFERAFHLNIVQFVRGVWSTETPEPPNTTPENHLTVPFETNNLGTRTISGSYQAMDLDAVLWIGKQVMAGSEGKLFYRGCLDQAMMEASNPAEITLDFDAAPTIDLIADFATARNTEIEDYFTPLGPTADNVRLVMFYQPLVGSLIARSILLLYIKGATRNKRNKKFFNTGGGS